MEGAIEERAVEGIEDEVAVLAASIAAAMGRFLELLGELDRRAAWAAQGFASLAHWLAWRCSLDLRTAREHVRVARAARELPRTMEALKKGELSYSKARAVTRVAEPETEERILEVARHATAAQLDRVLAVWRRGDVEGDRERAAKDEDARQASFWFDDDGTFVVQARLTGEEGALFLKAIEAARDAIWAEKKGTFGPGERADALALLADRSLGGERNGGDRTMVMVHVDAEVLRDPGASGQSRIEGAGDGPAEQSRRLACDASVVEVVHAADGTIELGRRRRTVSAAMRRALVVRDGECCTFPGCSRRIVDAHHIVHWIHGGQTIPSNLTQLCRMHHKCVHEGGFSIETIDGSVRFRRPDGGLVPAVAAMARAAPLARSGSATSLAPRGFTARIDWDAVAEACPC